MAHAFLIILDGFGIAEDPSVSAIDKAHKPYYDSLLARWPNSRLIASGEAVGLPEGQFGNSEVGHLNIGSGRIVWQDISRIDVDIRNGDFTRNTILNRAAENCTGTLHLMGLFSDGGVHSHIRHLNAFISLYAPKVKKVVLHLFGDGRDTDMQAGINYAQSLQESISKISNVHIGSLIGRYYAMDRDNRWERVQRAYDLLVHGKGDAFATLTDAFTSAYAAGYTDEFIEPSVIGNPTENRIETDDTVVFFNFRSDRAREITRSLTQPDFDAFPAEYLNLKFVCLTRYDESFVDVDIAFPPQILDKTLGEVVSLAGKTQVRIAETEKYPHVTYFFNGGVEIPYPGEKRIMIPSPKVATYDLQPEMSAPEVGSTLLTEMMDNKPDLIILNLANPDMVGHTGDMQAAIKAVEAVDKELARLVPLAIELDYRIIIIADHGNADCMVQADGNPHTFHTTAPVPCIVVNAPHLSAPRNGILADIAPTLLKFLEVEIPDEMTGTSLV